MPHTFALTIIKVKINSNCVLRTILSMLQICLGLGHRITSILIDTFMLDMFLEIFKNVYFIVVVSVFFGVGLHSG